MGIDNSTRLTIPPRTKTPTAGSATSLAAMRDFSFLPHGLATVDHHDVGVASPLESYVRLVVGPCDVVDRPRSTGVTRVIEVRDPEGRSWFGKRLHVPRQWRGETQAYRWWGFLEGRVPQLRDQQDELRALVTAGLPGRPADPGDAATFRRAGALLRRLHLAVPARDDGGEWLQAVRSAAQFETARCHRLGAPVDEQLVTASLAGLAELAAVPVVPCHGDFLPHNWLVDDLGEVRTMDFAEAGWRPLAHDFARLRFGPCWDREELYAAFVQGYGRELTDAENAFVTLHLAVNATTAVGWGTEHGRPLVRDRGLEVLDRLAAGKPYPARRSLFGRTPGARRRGSSS